MTVADAAVLRLVMLRTRTTTCRSAKPFSQASIHAVSFRSVCLDIARRQGTPADTGNLRGVEAINQAHLVKFKLKRRSLACQTGSSEVAPSPHAMHDHPSARSCKLIYTKPFLAKPVVLERGILSPHQHPKPPLPLRPRPPARAPHEKFLRFLDLPRCGAGLALQDHPHAVGLHHTSALAKGRNLRYYNRAL